MEKTVKKAKETGEKLKPRRRKAGAELGNQKRRLAIPANLVDNKTYMYRWATDVDARLHNLVKDDDWEFAKISGDEIDQTGAHKVHTGTKKDGTPEYQYLLRKHKSHYEADKAEAQASIDEKMNAVKREANNPTGANEYKPNSVNIEMR